MAMSVDYVRVLYRNSSVNIDLDGKMRTFSDLAEAAAVKHLGMTLTEAHVPVGALSLRGPVVAVKKDVTLAALNLLDGCVEFSDEIDRTRVTNGAWFLLDIDRSSSGRRAVTAGGMGASTVAGVGSSAALSHKRMRLADTSASFAASLAAALPAAIDTVTDLRKELAARLPGPVIVQSGQILLLAKGTAVLQLEDADGGNVMVNIEELFVSAWLRPVTGGTEEVWVSKADDLVGVVLTVLDRLTGALGATSNRNAVDLSGTADVRKRPDYWLLVLGALLLKAEYKRSREELADAKAELASKMNGWNTVALHGLAFLPCFAVAGELLQFCAVVHTATGALTVEDASPAFNMTVDLDRLRIVCAACNMFRVLVALRRRMPAKVPPLYTEQMRSCGTSITVMDTHVVKKCWPAPDGVYACLEGEGTIPCAIRVTSRVAPAGPGGMTHIKMEPVCVEAMPDSEADLQRAVCCVLRAINAFHARGFVHRDVRWPNVLRDPSDRGSLLIDFELAAPVGEPLPEQFHGSPYMPPEARGGGAYAPPGDVWQVGQLVRAWAQLPRLGGVGLSPATVAFVARLSSDDPTLRPTADEAMDDAWLKPLCAMPLT